METLLTKIKEAQIEQTKESIQFYSSMLLGKCNTLLNIKSFREQLSEDEVIDLGLLVTALEKFNPETEFETYIK